MELVYLQTFREVVKWGNYSRAAEELGYAQSSVTTQIQKLEDSYGAVLFERHGRKMRLTMAGETLLGYAQEIIRLHTESKQVIAQQNQGSLSIGTIETLAAYYLPHMLQTYRATHPDMNIVLKPGCESVILQEVKEGVVDFGLILDAPLTDPELHTLSIRHEELVIVTKPEHPIGELTEVGVRELEGETLILTEEGCTYRAMLLRALSEGGIAHQVGYEFGSLEAIKQCVIFGWGVAMLPRFAVQGEVDAGKMRAVPFVHSECVFHTQLIYLKRKWLPRAFEHFVALFAT